MKSESKPKRANWTKGQIQIAVFVRTGEGATIEVSNDDLDKPGAREEIRGVLSPFLGEEVWPDVNVPPLDGKDVLRPHSIAGWWQVWSGGVCIALLRPEDVAKFLEATEKQKPAERIIGSDVRHRRGER